MGKNEPGFRKYSVFPDFLRDKHDEFCQMNSYLSNFIPNRYVICAGQSIFQPQILFSLINVKKHLTK